MTIDGHDDAAIRDILATTRCIAVVGASANPARPSFGVMRFLLRHGFEVIPVNPGLAGQQVLDCRAVARLEDAGPLDMVDIFRAPEHVGPAVEDAIRLGARTVWMQLGVVDAPAAARARAAGLRVVMDRCPAIEWPRLGLDGRGPGRGQAGRLTVAAANATSWPHELDQGTMTNEERDLIARFIARVGGQPQAQSGGFGSSVPATAQSALPPIDPEADRFIGDNLTRYPEARYRITQMAVVQEAALAESQNRIKRLEWELQQAQAQLQQAQQQPQRSGGGLFGGLFGGNRQQQPPQQGYPPQQQGYGQQQGYQMGPPPQPAYSPGYQPGMFQRQGSGFLGSALTTAAGVAGGMVAGNALMNMFDGNHGGGGGFGGEQGGGFGGGEASPWGADAGGAGGGDPFAGQGTDVDPNFGSSDQGGFDNGGGGGFDSGGGGDWGGGGDDNSF